MSFEKDIARTQAQLTALNSAVKNALPRAARAGAGELKAEAIRQAPVRSGKLRNGISDREGTATEKTAVDSAVHVVFNSVFYAAPVEYGRYKRPFMRPAAKTAQSKMSDAMRTAVTRETDRVL